MIEVRDLRKNYGETQALRGVSLSIQRGEVVGLLGPNGAGKTTTMKILVGFLLPTSGTASVAGFDVQKHPLEVQQRIGYLPENAPLYHEMLVQEYLAFAADIHGMAPELRRERLEFVVQECGITGVLTRHIGHLSKGFRQRVGLAGAILHDPEILILDEPTTGLDPNQILEVRELIRRMGATKTVILSTHILSEVEATCSRALIIIDGVLRADGRLEELTHSHTEVVTLAAPSEEVGAALRGLAGVSCVRQAASTDGFTTWRLELEEGAEVGEAVGALAGRNGWRLRELRRDDKSLEQVFRELTLQAAGEPQEVA